MNRFKSFVLCAMLIPIGAICQSEKHSTINGVLSEMLDLITIKKGEVTVK